jgi:hypothetical protein
MQVTEVPEFQDVEVQAVSPSLAVGDTEVHPKFAPSNVTDADPVTGELGCVKRDMMGVSYVKN